MFAQMKLFVIFCSLIFVSSQVFSYDAPDPNHYENERARLARHHQEKARIETLRRGLGPETSYVVFFCEGSKDFKFVGAIKNPVIQKNSPGFSIEGLLVYDVSKYTSKERVSRKRIKDHFSDLSPALKLLSTSSDSIYYTVLKKYSTKMSFHCLSGKYTYVKDEADILDILTEHYANPKDLIPQIYESVPLSDYRS